MQVGDVNGEGQSRTNLAYRLLKLGRLEEARQEILRSIECAKSFGHEAEPWRRWAILALIESNGRSRTAAAQAKTNAINYYLAFRRDGGAEYSGTGRIAYDATEIYRDQGPKAVEAYLRALACDRNYAPFRPYLHALQSVFKGSRDRRLADSPHLDFSGAAEILFLIETLDGDR